MATTFVEQVDVVETPVARGISWRAIVAGAVVMAAIAIILTILGAGFGLGAISPWAGQNPSATKFAIWGGIWLIIVQWVSAGIGGYMAGRLGPELATRHVHEVAFRDTARGIVAWAVAAVITAGLLGAAASSLIGGTAHSVATVAGSLAQGTAQGAAQNNNPDRPSGYLVDTLFRKATPDANASPQDARGEVTRIVASGLKNGDVPQPDRAYLAQLVAARTGLSQDDAQKRVDTTIAQAKQTEQKAKEDADAARKVARDIALFTAFSMLVGVFIAGVCAKIGGDHRDALL
ncbi:MAG TPA: hypothetical protein VG308_15370 [Stellaceae bacterium]|nr:hypothetical protein [Stellaceae bacterium]